MKVNILEIYNSNHSPDALQQKVAKLHKAKLAATKQAITDDVNARTLNTIGQNVSEPEHNDVEAEKTLADFEARFRQNMHLHEGVEWNDVKKALKASPEALQSVVQMEAKGHDPDVYDEGDEYYEIGTCSKESPNNTRNCVYDEEAADWLKGHHPGKKFNGSAVETAETMGIKLMSPKQYKDVLQKKDHFDEDAWVWLLTRSDIRSAGKASYGTRLGGGSPRIHRTNAHYQSLYGGWRGSLRIRKVTA